MINVLNFILFQYPREATMNIYAVRMYVYAYECLNSERVGELVPLDPLVLAELMCILRHQMGF